VTGAKAAFAAICVASGIVIGWLAGGSIAAVSGLAVLLAAVNGYSKSYSP